MSSEVTEQATSEDVSFADILEQPEGCSVSPAPGKGADLPPADVPPTNGDAIPETGGAGEPTSPTPMEVSEDHGPADASSDTEDDSTDIVKVMAEDPDDEEAEVGEEPEEAAEEATTISEPSVAEEVAVPEKPEAAAEKPEATAEAPAAEGASTPEKPETAAEGTPAATPDGAPVEAAADTDDKATAAEKVETTDPISQKGSEPESSAKEESKPDSAPEKDSASGSEPKEAASKSAEESKPEKAAKAPKTSAEKNAASSPKAKPSAAKAAAKPATRPIPPDAEPIREFSSESATVAGPKPKSKSTSPEPLTELEKLWKPVKQNPADFTAWTLLIQYVEAQCFMEDIRHVLKSFLARYPYCYGYWKKYSDLEKKRGTAELCSQVFEDGLAAVPLSVDLWLHYLHHLRSLHEERPDLVRAGFERAIAACGTEFRSDRLWEQYASWETANKEPVKALAVYKRAIAVPTLSYRTHFENLEQFVGETPPQELLTVEEFLEARRAVLAELRASESSAGAAAAPPVSSDLLPPGCDEPPPGVPAQPAGLSSDEECVKLRARILAPLRQLHKDTEKQVSLRWNFEEGIKRPYFHVKPLEKAQLKNWKTYLEFEVEQGDTERIRVLFERCMISCALYEEYWLKYVRYLESLEPCDWDAVRAVYRRACWTHLPDKPAIHLLWATFEEKQGDLHAASEVLRRISEQVSMLEVTLRRINLSRRAGRLDEAEQLYASALKNTEHRETAVVIAVKFARFLSKVRDNHTKALEVLREAIRFDQSNMRLHMQMVDLGFQRRPVDVALVREAFDAALEAPFEQKDKLTLAHRRLEFLEEFDSDPLNIQKAHDTYYTLLKAVKAEAKKKKQEEEEAAAKKGGSGKRSSSSAANGTEKKARTDSAASGTQIPSLTETPARPVKTGAAPFRAGAAPVGNFNQPPPMQPQAGYGGYNQMGQPPPQQPQQYQYPQGGYQQQQAPGWTGYPQQYNYNQYGQGYQYPYQ